MKLLAITIISISMFAITGCSEMSSSIEPEVSNTANKVATKQVASTTPQKEELIDTLKKNPTNASALYNLGLIHYLDRDFDAAIKHWKTLKKLKPADWQVREKLIQAYWGGRTEKGCKFGDCQITKSS